jgi:hypothetical protein
MKRISLWARQHVLASRIIIICSFTLLTVLGIVTGRLVDSIGFSFSSTLIMVVIAIFFIGVLAYPDKYLKGKKLKPAVFYVRQKTCDFLLAASTFCMIVYFSNQPGQLFNYSNPLSAAVPASIPIPKDSTLKTYKTLAAFTASLKDENGKGLKWKEKKKLLREQIKAIKKSDMSDGGKVALIILSVLVAAGLLALVAALACDLSCNGAEGAAVLVLIGGIVVVGLLLILVIRAITGKKRKRKEPAIIGDAGG